MKIAVVGAGLAGLAAAWLLGRRHEVVLFERHPRPGFTAHSVTLDGGVRVDVPLRVFYGGYYPTLTRLYAALGVASEPVSYAASIEDAQRPGRLAFRYRNLRWGRWSVGTMAPQDLLLGPAARRIGWSLLRFHARARPALAAGALQGLSIGEYVAREGYPAEWADGFLWPAIATVCTCSCAQARDFPAAVIVDYLARGLARQAVRRALHGADDVERRLLAGRFSFHGGMSIEGLRRDEEAVRLRCAGSELRFDHVVLATQAHHARRLLADATPAEAALLDAFRYVPVEVVTHTDAALLPARRRDWSPVNLRPGAGDGPPQSTIWLNAVQPALRGRPDVFQTVHPLALPREGMLLGRAQFERPLVDAASQRALAALPALHREAGRRLWFCGAWAQAGIPLLESAVRSAHDVAEALGAPL